MATVFLWQVATNGQLMGHLTGFGGASPGRRLGTCD